jgi:chromosome segregation ATPase
MFAQSSPGSATPANEKKKPTCEGLARACNAAADEIIASRALIASYEKQIGAHEDRIKVAQEEIDKLKQISDLEKLRVQELTDVITAERTAIDALTAQKQVQEKRIAELERKAKRTKKLLLLTGIGLVIAIIVAIGK